jgi:alpha(1,3/1,4) fucosyltransferase
MEKIFSTFAGLGFKENSVFDLKNPSNRDNCFYPFHLMRNLFLQHGIEINTPDVSGSKNTTFSLDMDVHPSHSAKPRYLLMLETPQIRAENGVHENWNNYKKIFTWNDALVDGKRFIKINFPNNIKIQQPDGLNLREIFCCLISSNRALAVNDPRDLYKERVAAIRWFEKNAPTDFQLYGIDWNIPAAKNGLRGAIERRFWKAVGRVIKLHPFPSYRGRIERKHYILKNARFSICYENVSDLPGYITEKIFDCFFAGCIPIYWGARNITAHIPEDCFIDRRKFKDMTELYQFLHKMTDDEFVGYQKRISSFLSSKAAEPFSSVYFAETIVNTIVKDLGI